MHPDTTVINDNWSNLAAVREMPYINFARLQQYRQQRIKSALRESGAAMCILVNPISLRYAVDYKTYALFQSHIPTTYLFVPLEGPTIIHGVYGVPPAVDEAREGRAISFFDGGYELKSQAELFAQDVVDYLSQLGTDNRRIAIEYVNPSITQALIKKGLEVIDGVTISESARVIKSEDEIACIRWAVAVAQLGIEKTQAAIKPGVTENQLWALLNYTNLANNGDWHDGRMLASGPRINPWCQEASDRRLESGDLVGFDTDMIGPNGYFADISRTFYCGKGNPTKRQKQLYQLAVKEIEYNIGLIKPGKSLLEIQKDAFEQDESFHANAYCCLLHGVGMCDEYPRVNHKFRNDTVFDGTIEAGMVLCVESYVGAVGERDGVKLEQQIIVTKNGTELLSTIPYCDQLLN